MIAGSLMLIWFPNPQNRDIGYGHVPVLCVAKGAVRIFSGQAALKCVRLYNIN